MPERDPSKSTAGLPRARPVVFISCLENYFNQITKFLLVQDPKFTSTDPFVIMDIIYGSM